MIVLIAFIAAHIAVIVGILAIIDMSQDDSSPRYRLDQRTDAHRIDASDEHPWGDVPALPSALNVSPFHSATDTSREG